MPQCKHIAHIICPFHVKQEREKKIQQLTFEAIGRAVEITAYNIELIAVQYHDEEIEIPQSFTILKSLTRSYQDVGGNQAKRLPYIYDILEAAFSNTSAEYLIYSNMDIILLPRFYLFVEEKIDEGHDAFIINRRILPDSFLQRNLTDIYDSKGKQHPGFDCFVFKREIFLNMFLGEIIMAPFIGVTLAHNLFCHAHNPKLFDNENLTAHVGEKILGKRDEAYWHNRREFFRHVKPKLWKDFNIKRFPYSSLALPLRYYKWARNPSLFTVMNFKLELRMLLRGY